MSTSPSTQTRVLVSVIAVLVLVVVWLVFRGEGGTTTTVIAVAEPAAGDAAARPPPRSAVADPPGDAAPAPVAPAEPTAAPAAARAAAQASSVQTKHIKATDLDPWQGNGVCCKTLRSAALGAAGFPSDIQQLLPILAAYQREADVRTFVELGSRLGGSSITLLRSMSYDVTKRFATVDLQIRAPVKAMYQCEKECSGDAFPNREFFTVEGDDLQVPIPFVDATKADDVTHRPIDLLFIDTLHHAAQLEMELKRYARYVRKWIVFHDSYSFRLHNEGGDHHTPHGWPAGKPKPRGLQQTLREFLVANRDTWVEEMNNIHNNGFYVLRRRSESVSAWVASPVPRFSGIDIEPESAVAAIVEKPATNFHQQCEDAFIEMYAHLRVNRHRDDPPCHMAGGYSTHGSATNSYQSLIAARDSELPIAPLLGVIMAQVAAGLSTLQGANIAVWGCSAAVAIAALQAQDDQRRVATTFYATNGGCSPTFDATLRRFGKSAARDLPLSARTVDLLVVSAAHLAQLDAEGVARVLATVKHRIVAYGTSVTSVAAFHAAAESAAGGDPFELKLGLAEGAGVAMWERRSSTAMLYVPEAKTPAA
jgi:hypothetical protein